MEFIPNPTHPQHTPTREKKRKKERKKERKGIDGGLNKLSLLERRNFVHFNDFTISTSCPCQLSASVLKE